MAIAFRNSATGGSSSGTSHQVACPVDVAAGDLILIEICTGQASITMSPPAGFLRLPRMGGHAGIARNYGYYKIADGTEAGTTLTFTASGSTAASVLLVAYSGVHQTTPFGSAVGNQNAGGAGTLTIGRGAPPVAGGLLVHVGGAKCLTDETATAFSTGAAANWSRRAGAYTATSDCNSIVSEDSTDAVSVNLAGAGQTAWTVAGSSGYSAGVTLSLIPDTQTTPWMCDGATGANGAVTKTALSITAAIAGNIDWFFVPGVVVYAQWAIDNESAVFSSPIIVGPGSAMTFDGAEYDMGAGGSLSQRAAYRELDESDCTIQTGYGVRATSDLSVNWSGIATVIGGLGVGWAITDRQVSESASTTTPDPPAVSCGNNSVILVFEWTPSGAAATFTPSTNYTQKTSVINTAISVMRGHCEFRLLGTGSVTENPGTCTTASASWVNTTVALTPAGGCVSPTNAGGSDAPVISGTAEEGETLTVTDDGTWTGDATITFTYQWQRDCGGGYEDIVGATMSSYVLTNDEAGCTVKCVVTGSNGCDPDGTADSNELGPVIGIPVNTVPPTISGVPIPGHILEVTDNGTWTGSPTSYAYEWFADDGGGYVSTGETTQSILLDDADIGSFFKCEVTASN